MVSDETFFAWLDGELDAEEAARVASAVEADPELAAKAERHREMQGRLKGAFDQVLTAPVPGSIAAAARERAAVVDLAERRDARRAPSSGLPKWAAFAATLAIGLLAGMLVPLRGDGPVTLEDGKVYAAGALDDALDSELASAPSGGAVRVNLTFRDQGGAICRSFVESGASGLACRDGARWQVRGLFTGPEGQDGAYRMAAGMDPNLAALISSAMAGDPFDAAQEKAAKAKGWR